LTVVGTLYKRQPLFSDPLEIGKGALAGLWSDSEFEGWPA